jgi:hypothetical protein
MSSDEICKYILFPETVWSCSTEVCVYFVQSICLYSLVKLIYAYKRLLCMSCFIWKKSIKRSYFKLCWEDAVVNR